jgi:pullulanase-type alpha-1,6-glucosidase
MRRWMSASLLVALLAALVPLGGAALADDTPEPTAVTIAGNLQSELGCPGDWQPECAATGLTRNPDDGVWRGQLTVPAGSWEYKAPVNGSWDENYGRFAQRNGPNIPLNLDAERAVRFYYSHASHWLTDDVRSAIATVAGDFQSELGCPGDWQPSCLRSWLQDADEDGTYTFSTAAIPPGSYQFKVARDEGWDEAYPGDNQHFAVDRAGDRVTFTYRPADGHAVAVEVESAGPEPGDEDLATAPHRGFGDEVFYFVMPDRFANGDPTNDRGGIDGDRLDHGFDPTDKGFYHGGDLAGLLEKLDYIQGLGATAIWMTPMFENRPVQGVEPDISAGYHGYWITDFTRIDPHFGTNAQMTALVDAAHERGMKVFFDVITNHTADVLGYEGVEGAAPYISKAAEPYRDADGNPFDDRDFAGSPDFPALDAATSFPYVPVFPSPSDETAKTPSWLNDPTLYHNRGNSTFTGESSQYGDFFGLDDLFTEHPTVVDGMTEIAKGWISEFGIDGFRVDTVKHVNDEFWVDWVPAIEQHAAAEGIEDFFVFGEVFDGNPSFTSRYMRDLTFPSVLDFPFQGRASSFAATGAATDALRDLFAEDDRYISPDGNAHSLTTFLGNHDIGRIGHFIQGAGAAPAEQLQRSVLAHQLAFTARGMPVVYYGDEQGFTGTGGDKDARQDMFPSQTPSYLAEDSIGTDANPGDDNFDPTHPLYGTIADLAELRADHPALATGAQIHRSSSSSSGVYAFSRIDRDEQVEYVVALNNATSAREVTIPTYSAGMTFTEVYPGTAGSATTSEQAGLTLSVPALSTVVYRANAPLAPSEAAPGVAVTTPQRDAEVSGVTELGATVSTDAYAEVTFAVRTADDAEWEVVGTDDNAPYRVFLDTTRYAPGTDLQIKAVLRDRSGNISSARSVATVVAEPDEEEPGGSREFAIVHYQRDDGAEEDWGLHLWGDIADEEMRDWGDPKPFVGETDYGRFAWIRLKPDASQVGFIVYDGATKDVDADRFFNPNATPEIWLRQGDATVYTSQAAAQGYVELRYHRPDGDYGDYDSSDYNDFWGLHLWGDGLADGVGTDWTAPRKPERIDDDGAAVFRIPLADVTAPVNFIVHRGDAKDTEADRSFLPVSTPTPWVVSGQERVHASRGSALRIVTLHYHRPDGDYGDYESTNFNDFWGLHTWGIAADPGWTTPRKPTRSDGFGQVFDVPIVNAGTQLGYILHRGDEKDLPADQFLDVEEIGYEVWILSGREGYLLPVTGTRADADLRRQRAHWIDAGTIAWDVEHRSGQTYALHHDPEAGIALDGDALSGGESIALERVSGGLTAEQRARFPHLANHQAFRLPQGVDAASLLREQLVVSAAAGGGALASATGVQVPGALDDLYADGAADVPLGVTLDGGVPTLTLWAPTARSVSLHRFDAPRGGEADVSAMTRDDATGAWSVTGTADWLGDYYLYEVEVYAPTTQRIERNLVTDPYSLALAEGSTRSQVVDLSAPALAPAGWSTLDKPELADHADTTIYELHVRDFSIFDETVPAAHRGTFRAFTHAESDGMQHLRGLAEAGLTHLHLLPVFDIATVPENPADRSEPDHEVLASLPPDSEEQQALIAPIRDVDGFNWGYDPFHYTVPEGSYATERDGGARTREFREMVSAVNGTGLRVVMDVVYNHTHAAGQAEQSVLDRVVPGYYHRLLDDGAVATSTCCPNTATEHAMMERLMVDSVVTWAREYKVDGFRFDLMGHHSKDNMLAVRAALDALTLEADGVDGAAIVLYGEGWNFGEVANDARFEQATQANMAGTGIGTFNDRLRDAVRGGGPFDDDPRFQGFGSGLHTAPNPGPNQGSAEQQRARLLHLADLVRVGLAGNLADYAFTDRTGAVVTGAQVDYNGSPAGYNAIPHEAVNYVSKHDNETLYDALAYKLPQSTSMADRARMQSLSLATVALSQGMPFFHAGSDLLRSKSLDRDSYNSGDWFNRLDWTYQENNFGVGLPPAWSNASKWQYMRPLLADPNLQATPEAIAWTRDTFRELLAIRTSSPLFSLGSAEEVAARLTFANTGPDQIPGVIALRLADDGEDVLDEAFRNVVVVFNATPAEVTVPVAGTAEGAYTLHPVQADSADPVVRGASAADGSFTVPARTTAVFVELRQDDPDPDPQRIAFAPGPDGTATVMIPTSRGAASVTLRGLGGAGELVWAEVTDPAELPEAMAAFHLHPWALELDVEGTTLGSALVCLPVGAADLARSGIRPSEAGLVRLGDDGPAELLPGVGPSRNRVCAETDALSLFAAGVERSVRLRGPGRIETAVAVSQRMFDPSVETVVLATAGTYPDALAAGPMAAAEEAPILLTRGDGLPAVVREELERLDPSTVVLVGGPAAISAAVEEAVAEATDAEVTRIAGRNRFETAAEIAAASGATGGTVYVATGQQFADALAGGPAAALADAPVLLVARNAVPGAVEAELERRAPEEIVVLGGTAAVSPDVVEALEAHAPVRRVFGRDRFATAAAIAADSFGDGAEAVFLATGRAFPDALASVPAAALTGAPLLLVQPDGVPAPARDAMSALQAGRQVVLGGTAAIAEGTAAAASALLRTGHVAVR